MTKRERIEQGITVRHQKACASKNGNRCNCSVSYQATAWSNAAQRNVRRSFAKKSEAKAWRARMIAGHADRVAGAVVSPVLDVLAEQVFEDMERGALLNRSGDPFQPSVARSYRSCYDTHIRPLIGGRRLTTITRRDVQVIVDEATARGLKPSTARNALMPLRLIFRVAIRDELGVDSTPIQGVELPAVRGRRDTIASPADIAPMLFVLQPKDRAVWATAMMAGLRRGELMALRWMDVDLDAGEIRVQYGYDPRARKLVRPKSAAGVRTVPVVKALRVHLLQQRLLCADKSERGYAFSDRPQQPFCSEALARRATKAWSQASIPRLTLHECRHTFASMMIAAGANAKTLQEIGGWSSIQMVFDRYGHLMPGARSEAAGLLDAYLEREAGLR